MKKSRNGKFTIYEENDKCALDEYSKVLAEELEKSEEEQDKTIQKNTETIESLQKENIELKAENERLNNDINAISVTEQAEGENITLNDTAEARFKKFVIGGNSWQETREGYNLIPFTYETKTVNGVTFTVNDDGTIKVDGTATANTYFDLGKPTLPAGDYILTGLPGTGSSATFKITFKFEGTQQNLFGTDGKTFTINSEATAQENYLFIASGYTASNLVFKPMITKGATVKDYEPYGAMPSPNYKSDIQNVTGNANVTVCNKNLFNLKNSNPLFINGTTAYEKDNTSIKVFTTYKEQWGCVYFSVGKIKNYVGKTITLSADVELPKTGQISSIGLYSIKKDGSERKKIKGNGNITQSGQIVITTEIKEVKDADFIALNIYANISTDCKEGDYTILKNIQIEENTTITNYAEHKEQNFTFPLAEGQRLMKGDYLADDGIHHKRGQIVFDGTENWQFMNGVFRLLRNDLIFENSDSSTLMCTHYQVRSQYQTIVLNWDNSICTSIGYWGSAYKFFAINDQRFTNANDFKSYLAEQYENGTPVIVELNIQTEEIEPYISEEQAVYNEIKKTAHSYGEQTHIFCTDETSLIFSVEARKDMNTVISNIESMILANASEEV